MRSRDFCYWLQGFFELTEDALTIPKNLTPAQVETVKRHLAMVFKHEIDPTFGGGNHQLELGQIHDDGGMSNIRVMC